MKAHIPLLVVCWLLHGPVHGAKPVAKPAPEERLLETLEEIVIPKFELREATFEEALDFLRAQIRRHHPQGSGIAIKVELRQEIGPPSPPPDLLPGLPPPDIVPAPQPPDDTSILVPGTSATTNPADARITVSLTNIPVYEALRYVTGLTNTKFWIRPDGIHIVSVAEPEPLFTRDIRISSDYFSPLAKAQEPNAAERAAKAKMDIVEYLTANGVSFPKGSAAILNDQGTRLTVHTTEDQVKLIETILKSVPSWQGKDPDDPYEIGRVPGPEVPKVDPPSHETGPFTARMEAVKRKLQKVTLPSVALDHVALREAVATLCASQKLGDVLVRVAQEPSVPGLPDGTEPGTPDNPWISYTARKVSLWNALNAVARSRQFMVRVEPYAVTLAKIQPPEGVLVTHEYLPPPHFFTPGKKSAALQQEWEKLRDPEQPSAKDWLVGGGVTFATEKSAIYIVRGNRLIIRNTPEYQQKVQALILQEWREYYASDEWKKRKHQ